MTTIKVKNDLPITGCDNCPFVAYQDEYMFGEVAGYTAYCKLMNVEDDSDNVAINGDCYDGIREDKLDGCPIIECTVEEQS